MKSKTLCNCLCSSLCDSASRVWNIGASHIEDFGPCYNVKSHVCHDFLVLSKNILGKAIDSYWFKMSCLISLVFHCVYCFFLKRWNYIKIFVLHKLYFCKKNLLQIDVINVAKIYVIYYRSIFILRRTLLWIFGKWKRIGHFKELIKPQARVVIRKKLFVILCSAVRKLNFQFYWY